MSVESRWKWNPLDATTIQTKERKLELKSGRKSYQIDCRGLGFICSLRHYLLEWMNYLKGGKLFMNIAHVATCTQSTAWCETWGETSGYRFPLPVGECAHIHSSKFTTYQWTLLPCLLLSLILFSDQSTQALHCSTVCGYCQLIISSAPALPLWYHNFIS